MTFLDDVVQDVEENVLTGYYKKRPEKPVNAVQVSLEERLESSFTIIAEIKPRSPTHGTLFEGDATKLAETYKQNGAGAISVLCEPTRFGGSLENLSNAKKTGLPVLAKDFVLSFHQLDAYKAFGADAVLLIHELFDVKKTEGTLEEFIAAAHEKKLEVVLEVHARHGLEEALHTKADVIGINNRDLYTLALNPLHYQNALGDIQPDRPVIAESGFKSKEDLEIAKAVGINGVLVGTALLESGDPAKALRNLQ